MPSFKKHPTEDELSAIALLKTRGYNIKKTSRYEKHTFEVELAVLAAFRAIIGTREIKVKEAINEALSDWVHKHSNTKSTEDGSDDATVQA